MSRTVVMGILNITPDSFADGGKYLSKDDAVTGGRRLVVEGLTLLMLVVNLLDQVLSELVKQKN